MRNPGDITIRGTLSCEISPDLREKFWNEARNGRRERAVEVRTASGGRRVMIVRTNDDGNVEFADEKLRQKLEKICGEPIPYLYADERQKRQRT